MFGLSSLLALIPGIFTTISSITNAISNEKIALINAQTDQERIKIQEEITSLQAKRDVLIEDSKHSKLDIWMRFIIAVGPAMYLFKIFAWDKVITGGNGSTDPIDANLWNVIMVVIGFYFLSATATTITRILKG